MGLFFLLSVFQKLNICVTLKAEKNVNYPRSFCSHMRWLNSPIDCFTYIILAHVSVCRLSWEISQDVYPKFQQFSLRYGLYRMKMLELFLIIRRRWYRKSFEQFIIVIFYSVFSALKIHILKAPEAHLRLSW